MTIHDFEHKLLGLIDGMVATATDDELFAGVICVATSRWRWRGPSWKGKTFGAGCKELCAAQPERGDPAGELSEQDEKLVQAMWIRLQQQAEA